MKQTIIMIVCVIILVIGGIFQIKYLEKSSVYIISDMEYIQNAIQNKNFDIASEQIDKTYDTWTKTKNIWNMFIVHDEIDDIDEAMIELREYIKTQNEEESMVAVTKIKEFLKHTVQRQEVRIDNIL